MKLREFALLADENIHPEITRWLREVGCDTITVADCGLLGCTDTAILHRAHADSRLVLTHDSDFGRLAIADGEPLRGIIYLRPGHIDVAFTIGSLMVLLQQDPEITPPMIIAVRRAGATVRIRVRPIT